MGTKNWLTVFHCVMAMVVYSVGLGLAANIDQKSPLWIVLICLGAFLLPIIVATRVSWAAGYAAGREKNQLSPPIEKSHHISI
jgi:hypothetical protein